MTIKTDTKEDKLEYCPACGHDLSMPVLKCDADLTGDGICKCKAEYEGWYRLYEGRIVKIRVCEAHKHLLIGFKK